MVMDTVMDTVMDMADMDMVVMETQDMVTTVTAMVTDIQDTEAGVATMEISEICLITQLLIDMDLQLDPTLRSRQKNGKDEIFEYRGTIIFILPLLKVKF